VSRLILLLAGACYAGITSASLNPFQLLVPKDAASYTERMASRIKDTPECQKYKDAILAHAKGNPADGKTVTPIVAAHSKAREAGCTK